MRFIRRNIKTIIIIITLLLIVSLGLLKVYLNNNSKIKEDNLEEELEIIDNLTKNEEELNEETIKPELVFVDIKGAVINPGVYEIEDNKKVIDVINLAGGLSDNADTTLINLAKQVKEEMVVIVYTKEEVEKAKTEDTIVKIIDKECVCPEVKNDACIENTKEETTETIINGKVNLNEATLEELLTLTGIGESKAEAIIEYRKTVGKFNNIEEIKNVTGIGDALYDKIKENITV